ncbi:hypothetical protein DL93DRAFT_2216288 [Clavulina sp. PMI_390]|nr:hypothetical protein DL93DRAFT_2216288 [Clavulina sp. PMI_390]
MMVDESLWNAFFEAQDNLLAAILSSAPPQPHILSVDGFARETLRSSGQASLHALNSSVKRMEDAQLKASRMLQEARALLINSLAPIHGVPLEILQSVVKLIIDSPVQTRRIEWFRDINQHWRSAIEGLPHLFARADWNRWSLVKIRRWTLLAQTHPLFVTIEEEEQSPFYPRWVDMALEMCPRSTDARIMSRNNTTVTERCQLATELAPHLGVLRLRTFTLSSEMVEHGMMPLLTSRLPNLSTLFLFSAKSERISINPANMPKLTTFHFRGIEPLFLEPLADIRDTGIGSNIGDLSEAFNSVNTASLARLTLYQPTEILPSLLPEISTIQFPSLTSLRLSGFGRPRPGQSSLEIIMKAIAAPNLSCLEIPAHWGVFIIKTVIKSLVLFDVSRFSEIMQPLQPFSTQPFQAPSQALAFPNLEEIIVKRLKPSPPSPVITTDDQPLKQFVQARKGRFKRLVLGLPLSNEFRDTLIQAGDLEQASHLGSIIVELQEPADADDFLPKDSFNPFTMTAF